MCSELPRGTGVIVREYRHPARRRLARRLVRLCRRRGLPVLIGADPALARATGADGVHVPRWAPVGRTRRGLRTVSVHGRRDIRRARESGAPLVLLSPVFSTLSHPLAPPLGRTRFALLAREFPAAVAALGGVTRERLRLVRRADAVCASGALARDLVPDPPEGVQASKIPLPSRSLHP